MELVKKLLTSRKFWGAIAASGPFAVMGDWSSFSNVWLAFVGAQGVVDTATALGKPAGVDHKGRP